jgi:hypothetical protein
VMLNGQLELAFGANRQWSVNTRRQRRMTRAQWWFERMREVVERAIEPRPMAPPEQLWSGVRRG